MMTNIKRAGMFLSGPITRRSVQQRTAPVYMVLVLDHIWQVENPHCWHTRCYKLFMNQLWLSVGNAHLASTWAEHQCNFQKLYS